MSVLRRSHLPSGCRRTIPDAVHGTSARMRSNGRPSHQAAGSPASPTTVRTPLGREPQPRKILAHAGKARFVAVERREIESRQLGEMRGLPAGRRTGVQHPHPVVHPQQRHRQLRAGVLYGERAVGEARELGHRARRRHDDASLANGLRADVRGRQLREQRIARRDPAIHAQRQRRAFISGRQNLRPMLRMIRFDPADPPARIRPAGDRTRSRHLGIERVTFAQIPAKQRIEERLRLRTAHERRRLDRLVDDGKRRCVRMVELIERYRDQRRQRRIRKRFRGERLRQSPSSVPSAATCHRRAPAPARVRACSRHRPRRPKRPAASRRRTPCAPRARPVAVHVAPGGVLGWPGVRASSGRTAKRPPGAIARPAANARAGILLPPAGCTACNRSAPSPQATSTPSPWTASTVPGGTGDGCGDRLGRPDLDGFRGPLRMGARDRVERPDCTVDDDGRLRPVDRRVGARDLRRIGDAVRRLRCRRQHAVAHQSLERRDNERSRPPSPAWRSGCRRFRAA